MEHGLEDMFYVKKHITPQAMCSNPLLVLDKLLGVPAFVRLAYYVRNYVTSKIKKTQENHGCIKQNGNTR